MKPNFRCRFVFERRIEYYIFFGPMSIEIKNSQEGCSFVGNTGMKMDCNEKIKR